MRKLLWLPAMMLAGSPTFALAAGTIDGGAKQATNWSAITMFVAFVILTLVITYWAARHTRTTKDFYAAGGGVSGFSNGLAIAGDYMSAASFLGISALVFGVGYYGLIYSIGFLVGCPVAYRSDRRRVHGRYSTGVGRRLAHPRGVSTCT